MTIASETSSRRHFLASGVPGMVLGFTGIAGLSGLYGGSVHGGETKKRVRLGGPFSGKLADPESWAEAAKKNGYRAVYAPSGLKVDEGDRVRAYVQAAQKRDLVFAEVGRWCNPMEADPEKRKANHERIIEGLALAEELGARCCVDIAGSFHPTSWYGPAAKNLSEEFFDLAVENARKFIDAVKPKRTHFAYEAMGWSLPHDPDSYLKLLKAIDRKAFGVHLDICNMVNSPQRFWNMTGLINEAFDKLGPWIVSCHAKDLRWETEMNIHFVECEIGQGQMDYVTLLKRLADLPGEVPLMMEHQKDQAAYLRCRDEIMKVGRGLGISFE